MIVIDEVNPTGILSNQDLNDFACGFAGTSFTNNFTGGITHFFKGFSTPAVKNPIRVGAFHTDRRPRIVTSETKSLPGGWRMVFDYGVSITSNRITIVSADQTVTHYQRISREQAEEIFNIQTTHAYIFVNLADFSYIERNSGWLLITDRERNVIRLLDSGRIRDIRKNDGSLIDFIVDNNNRIGLIEADGHQVHLQYNSNNFLVRVEFIHESKSLEFIYEGIHILRSIRLRDDSTNQILFTAQYIYDTSSRLIRVIDEKENIATSFSYMFGRVGRVTNQTFNPLRNGAWIEFIFRDASESVHMRSFTGKSLFHYYNRYGMLIQKADSDLNAIATKYTTIDDRSGIQAIGAGFTNYDYTKTAIMNHSFDVVDPYNIADLSLYTELRLFSWYADDVTTLKITTGGLQGRQILRVGRRNRTNTIRQAIRLDAGNYNLSFYAKTINITGEFRVIVRFAPNDPAITVNIRNSPWRLYRIDNINILNNNTLVYVEISCDNLTSGFVYFDNFQINNADISKVNLINNGFFKDSFQGIPLEWWGPGPIINFGQVINLHAENPLDNILGNRCFQFNANTARQVLRQTILVSGNPYDKFNLVSWVRGNFANNNVARIVVLLINDTIRAPEVFQFDITNLSRDWQMLVHKIMAKDKFDRIWVEYHYLGETPFLIAGIQMFQFESGSNHDYDHRGNLLTLAQTADTRNTMVYDNEERVTQLTDNAGNLTRLFYDLQRRLGILTDHNRNMIQFNYDENSNLIRTRIRSLTDGNMTLDQDFNAKNQLISQDDEFGNRIMLTYDRLGRVDTKTDPTGTRSNLEYDQYGNIVVFSKSRDSETSANKYEYNEDLSLNSVTADNATKYEFKYDEWGRVTHVLANELVLSTYRYNRIINGINSGLITTHLLGDNENADYVFVYNENNLISRIYFGNHNIATYHYNEQNQIIRSLTASGEHHYTYDNVGNLIKEVGINKVLGYEYDNLNALQKFSYNINNTVRSYDFEYANEYAGYNNLVLRERMLRTFIDDDISTYYEQLFGVRGFKPIAPIPGIFRPDEELGENVAVIRGTGITYDLNTVNSNRPDFTEEDFTAWRSRFHNNKTFYGWFNFEELNSEQIFLRVNNPAGTRVSVLVSIINNQYDFRLRWTDINGGQVTSREIRANRNQVWHFVGINISSGNLLLQVNNEFVTIVLSSINPQILNRFILDAQRFTLSAYMLGMGATRHTNRSFNAMASQLTRLLDLRRTLTPKSGVQFERASIYDNFHTVSLNGTFTSKFGVNPFSYVDVEREFNVDKLRLFEYDTDSQKHVYGSYSGQRSLAPNVSALAYRFDFRSSGSMSIRFKPILSDGNQRIIFENRSGIERFGVRLNPDNSLILFTTRHSINMPNFTCNLGQWYSVAVSWNLTRFTMFVETRQINLTDFMSFNGVQTNIGASITNKGISSNWLNGQLEMLTFTPYLPQTNQILALLNDNPFASVKTHIDALGRVKKEVINTGRTKFESEYSYTIPDNNLTDSTTSMQVNEIRQSNGNQIRYEYDDLGNITVIDNGDHRQEFEYDYLSRLIKEYNTTSDLITTITYTDNGNIRTKTVFESGGYPSSPLEILEYEYDAEWPDRLVRFHDPIMGTADVVYNYDSNYAGNPSQIGIQAISGRNLEWEGRNLIHMHFRTWNNTFNINYEYNEVGIRLRKVVNNQVTTYELNGTDIILERTGNQIVRYHYNERGMLVGFEFNNQNYFYVRDLLGIITEIINEQGETEVTYRYDAWGRIVYSEPYNSPILQVNNFVYKGYYLDRETNYYYLKSRYYDPWTSRFINADRVEFLDTQSIGGTNLFAYCNNNPVMYSDSTGTIAISILIGGLIIGALIVGGVETASQINEHGWNPSDWNWKEIGVAAITGAVQGAIFAFTGGAGNLLGAGVIGFLSGFAGNFMNQILTDMLINGQSLGQAINSLDRKQLVISGLIGGVVGGMSFGLGRLAQKGMDQTNKIIQDAMKQRVMAGLNPVTSEMMRTWTGLLFVGQQVLPGFTRAGLRKLFV